MGDTEPAESIPLLRISNATSFLSPVNDANNNDTMLADDSENKENLSIANRVDASERDIDTKPCALPDINIVRPSGGLESAADRTDVSDDHLHGDFFKRVRKPSNRFLVNTNPLIELADTQPPTSPSSTSVRLEDDEVFTSNSQSDLNSHSPLQTPNVNIFERDQLLRNNSGDSQETNARSVSRISIRSVAREEAGKIAEQGRRFANRQTERLVSKDGTCNIVSKNVPRGHSSWSRDIFTTLLDLRWRFIIIVFAAVLVGSWFFFAILWWAISILHGDHLEFNRVVEVERLPNLTQLHGDASNSTRTGVNSSDLTLNVSTPVFGTTEDLFKGMEEVLGNSLPCVYGVHNFITALLFSIETQQTIGYGTRYITANSIYGIILLVAQSCTGMVLLALTTGIIHSKVCKPKSRAHTMMFSRFAVICLRDDEYCLLFRVGDMRRSYLIGTSIRAIVMKAKLGDEKLNPLSQHTLELENDLKDASPLLIWPVTMVHRINESSPLWCLSVEELIEAKFEIVVVLEGTIEHTGMTAQFRTSYLPSEILWGHHLTPLLTYQKQNGKYEIDFTLFHNVIPIKNMPECSAQAYANVRKGENRVRGSNPTGFATGAFRRSGRSRSTRKKQKKDKDDNQAASTPEPHQNGNKFPSLKLPATPNLSINRISMGNAARSILRSLRQERPKSARS